MAGDFGGQPNRNAAGTVQQCKGQPCRQLARLFGRTIVIGDEIDRAFVDFTHQQAGDFGQACFGITHGGCPIAITAAKVALPVHQRVTLREILGHAHQRVVSRLVTMRMEPAQHIAHHPGAFDGFGAGVATCATKTQTHARHGIQNAPLHGLHAVTNIRQSTALDHAQRVFEISPLGVSGQVKVVTRIARGCNGGARIKQITHSESIQFQGITKGTLTRKTPIATTSFKNFPGLMCCLLTQAGRRITCQITA